ncbi:uncharacterized protein LOC119932464 isoform X2 [Tachyglossus aculeatus]|uniref:uncharacterized protein LOC119932464 isoform X2 n=1 Tax=Tachyglossus aculeatus TaxID=9261 RepID=UPI0018F64CDF|nr:uncharacterized protein LOC119932464 isoform X2 [Tachyglossus aculeatus]
MDRKLEAVEEKTQISYLQKKGKHKTIWPKRVTAEKKKMPGVEQVLLRLLTVIQILLKCLLKKEEKDRRAKHRCSHAGRETEAEGNQEAFPPFPIPPCTPRTPPPSLELLHTNPHP